MGYCLGAKCGALGLGESHPRCDRGAFTAIDDFQAAVDGVKPARAEAESARRQCAGACRRVATNLAQTGCQLSISKVAAHVAEPDKRSNLKGWMHWMGKGAGRLDCQERCREVHQASPTECSAFRIRVQRLRAHAEEGAWHRDTHSQYVCLHCGIGLLERANAP